MASLSRTEPTTTMRTLDRAEPTRQWVLEARARGECVGLVPTMGALHEGHLSLATAAVESCERVVSSVFVNPTQFSPEEDYDRYPRDLDADRRRLEQAGVDLLFAPPVEELYPRGAETTVNVGSIGGVLEGVSRPTHFRGVATVVTKLLQVAPVDRLFLGQKDYQQTVVLKQVVRDLMLPVEVVVCPTVREQDGLAMSSRNSYLSAEERARALVLPRTLNGIVQAVAQGEDDVQTLRQEAESAFASEPGVTLDYLAFLAPGTVDPAERAEAGVVVAAAIRVGKTRLIDNEILA